MTECFQQASSVGRKIQLLYADPIIAHNKIWRNQEIELVDKYFQLSTVS